MIRTCIASLLALFAFAGTAAAQTTCGSGLPNQLANGNVADATQVMADPNYVLNYAPAPTAWKPYTPALSCQTGTLGTATATGRYALIGKSVLLTITVNITTNGTCAGYVGASLPATPASTAVLAGRENLVTGKMLQVVVAGGIAAALNYDNSYPGATGAQLFFSGVYESQ